MNSAGAVVVIGGGPSVTLEDVEYCRGKARVIAIKEAVRLAPWANVLYFCDYYWYEERAHRALVDAFPGPVATIEESPGSACPPKRAAVAAHPNWKLYKHTGVEGLCEDPDGLRTGHNSGYQAINLAYHLGAKLIVLLGMDMRTLGGRMHWFERENEHSEKLYQDLMVPNFTGLAAALAAKGVRVVNASMQSALECFEKRPLREVLC